MPKYPNYISQEEQEQFERFLLGRMDAEEQTLFRQNLTDDKNVAAAFEEFKQLFLAIEEKGLRAQLENYHSATKKVSETKKSAFYRYRIAAGVAVLVTMGIWFMNQPTSNQSLFEEHFSPDPGLPTVMGANSNYDFNEAMVDYKQKNYDVAIGKWEKILEQKPNNDTLNYFLGAANLAEGNTGQAIDYFDQTLTSESPTFKSEALYYLALAHLKENNTTEAVKSLKMSSDTRSKQLLNKIQE